MTTQDKPNVFVDPVCGMSVDPSTAPAKTNYDGLKVYFCAEGCKKTFEANPQKYTRPQKKKGIWQRYLDRLNKATGGHPPACH